MKVFNSTEIKTEQSKAEVKGEIGEVERELEKTEKSMAKLEKMEKEGSMLFGEVQRDWDTLGKHKQVISGLFYGLGVGPVPCVAMSSLFPQVPEHPIYSIFTVYGEINQCNAGKFSQCIIVRATKPWVWGLVK